MHRQAGWSALTPEPPGHGQGPLTGKDGEGSYSGTLRITIFFLSPILYVFCGEEAKLACANEKNDIGWGPWLEEGLCIFPHGNDIQNNMQMSMAAS